MTDDAAEEREILSAKISRQSAEGWRNYCAANGISLTSMLEVAGLELAVEPVPPMTEARIEMIEKARQVDIKRRSRKPKS